MSAGHVLGWTAGAALAVLVCLTLVAWRRPRLLVRAILWICTHSVYRLRTHGLENVPAEGPALLVSNHVTYLDWLFIVAGLKRHVHFVIFAGWTRRPLLGKLLAKAGVIPIDHTGGPRAIIKSLRTAGDYLKEGKLVCIFAEGRFTRTGFLLPFKRGFEQILKHGPAPIVPVYLDQAWGSILSYYDGKLIWKAPRRLPFEVGVAFGKPLPAEASAFEVRQSLQLLSATAQIARRQDLQSPVQRFVRRARLHPWRPCLLAGRGEEKALSYSGVLAAARALAKQLEPQTSDGELVLVYAVPGQTAALANIALAILGRPVVNLDPRDGAGFLTAILRETGARRVLWDGESPPAMLGQAAAQLQVLNLKECLKLTGAVEKTRAIVPLPRDLLQVIGLVEKMLALRPLPRSMRRSAEELATVVFRSPAEWDQQQGDAADRPIGVRLTGANLAANCESLRRTIGPASADRCLGLLPFSDSFGYTITLWLPLTAGASVGYVAPAPAEIAAWEKSSVAAAAAACRRLRCTAMPIPSRLLGPLLDAWSAQDAASLRTVICAGGPLDADVAERCQQAWKIVPLEGYGRHELAPAAIVSVPDRSLDGFTQHGAKPGSVGQPLPGVAARIVDRRSHAPLPPGEAGLLLALGANLSPGYWRRPDIDSRRFLEGWFITGDEAMIDEDGFVSIVRREETIVAAAPVAEAVF